MGHTQEEPGLYNTRNIVKYIVNRCRISNMAEGDIDDIIAMVCHKRSPIFFQPQLSRLIKLPYQLFLHLLPVEDHHFYR